MIRRSEKKDIPQIMDLLIQVDMVHHNGRPDIFKGPATKYTEEELADILEDDTRPVFVAVDGDRVLGHAFCIHEQVKDNSVLCDVRTLYIDDICVDESARGQKTGKALYEHVASYAENEGFYNITLNVWNCNPGAMAFYEAMGLKPMKVCMEMILKQEGGR